jgi:hypothetical protein
MSIASLPFVTGDASLEDALKELRESRQSGLAVLKDDHAVLFEASELHAQVAEGGANLMKDIAGGTRIPSAIAGAAAEAASAVEAALLRTEGGHAVVQFFSKDLSVRLGSRLYYCNANDDHIYNDADLLRLKKISGGWECETGDHGLVS